MNKEGGEAGMTEQEKRERVIKGLGCCVNGFGDCDLCPYDKGRVNCDCGKQLYADALALLEAQEMVDAIPVEWLKRLMLSRGDNIDKVEFAWIMRKWESAQKERGAETMKALPTWMEWLAANVPGVDADSIYEAARVLNQTRIPADIARKLGIVPEEG